MRSQSFVTEFPFRGKSVRAGLGDDGVLIVFATDLVDATGRKRPDHLVSRYLRWTPSLASKVSGSRSRAKVIPYHQLEAALRVFPVGFANEVREWVAKEVVPVLGAPTPTISAPTVPQYGLKELPSAVDIPEDFGRLNFEPSSPTDRDAEPEVVQEVGPEVTEDTITTEKLKEILPIGQANVGDEEVNTVNARYLHEALGVGKDFSNWIKDRIRQCQLVEKVDYLIIARIGDNSKRGPKFIEYHLTLDAGKHLAMMERNERGKAVRQYLHGFESDVVEPEVVEDTKALVVAERTAAIKATMKTEDGRVTVTSLYVAEVFGKEHKNVIRDIEALDCSQDFNRLNFEPISYTDARNRQKPMYLLTRDGFMFVAMGFTGKQAALWKEAFIAAFNAMEAEIKTLRGIVQEQNEVIRDRDPEVAAAMKMMAEAMKANTEFMMQHLAQKSAPKNTSGNGRPKSVQDDPIATDLYDRCNAQVKNIVGYTALVGENLKYDKVWTDAFRWVEMDNKVNILNAANATNRRPIDLTYELGLLPELYAYLTRHAYEIKRK